MTDFVLGDEQEFGESRVQVNQVDNLNENNLPLFAFEVLLDGFGGLSSGLSLAWVLPVYQT